MATVFITGGSSGIGKELAELFAEKKYDLILLSRTQEKLEKVKDKIEKRFSVKCIIIECDLRIIENIQKAHIDKLIKDSDPDIFINCAGIGKIVETCKMTVEEEIETINVNFISPMILTKIFLESFSRKEKRTVINICSMASLFPHPYMAGYSASKSGLLFYSLAVEEELRKKKSRIRIISICPGTVSTGFFPENTKKKFGKMAEYSMTPKKAAEEIFKAYEKNKKFVVLGIGNQIMFKFLNFFPFKLKLKIIGEILKKGL